MTNDKPQKMPNNIPPFVKFCCANVPAVFDDSLSYYEALCALWKYLQDCIDVINNNALLEEEYIEKFNLLKEYVENYFDNLDVQEEINNKLDAMVEDGTLGNLIGQYVDPKLNDFKSEVNSELSEMRDIVEAVGSSSPIPVASTSDMTDHNKIYVLTSDGYWYYWGGADWTRGGVYQATEIADGSVTPLKTTFSKRSSNLIDIKTVAIHNWVIDTNPVRIVTPSSNPSSTIYIPVTGGNTYTFIRKSSIVPRFIMGFTATIPDNDVPVYGRYVFPDNALSYTVTAPSNAVYAVINFTRDNTIPAGYTANDLLALLCVNQGTSSAFEYSYIIDVKTNNLDDSCVTPDKVSFNKDSRNLFNKNNPDLGTYHFVSGVVTSDSPLGSITIPCEPNKVYTVLKRKSERFEVGTTNVKPEVGVPSLSNTTNNSATKIKITTPPNANYLLIYCYNGNRDTLTLNQILESICVTEGDNDVYMPYGKIIRVFTDNYDDKSVTMDKLSDEIKNTITGIDPIQSRSNIYGVTFDLSSNSSKGSRIGNAVGLHNDYIVGETFQLNGGVNDFDNIYPWSDMRKCNVKFVDGVKTVTYEDEDDFALDGSNGEVMVEIPKFYSYRKVANGKETWAISGEPKAEFKVEPAFVVDDKELDYIYVACYNGSKQAVNGCYSTSGTEPVSNKIQTENIADYNAVGFNGYDISVFFALQKLMMIEFADRNVQDYLGGITYLPYFYRGDSINLLTGVGSNTVTINNNDGGGRKSALWVGERIKFIPNGINESSEEYARYITDITTSGSTTTITYSGSDLSGVLSVGDGIGGCGQKSGLTDDLTYHTGRTTYASGNAYESYVNPMKYRNIENLYGNVWEQVAGIRVMDLDYYLSYEPDMVNSVTDSPSDYFKAGYKAPLQNQLGEGGAGYIVKEGYDNNDHNLALPVLCGIVNGGGDNKYWSDAFYSKNESPTKQYESVVGGGWDHYKMAGIFCLRSWNDINSVQGLYSNRPIYRG